MMSDDYDQAAIHEASHAVAGALLRCQPRTISLVPLPEKMIGGMVELTFDTAYNASDLRRHIAVMVAGRAGERIATGAPLQPYGHDSTAAWRLAQRLHGIEADEDALQKEIDAGIERAEVILRLHWPTVLKLAQASRAWFAVVDEFQTSMLEAGAENEQAEIRAVGLFHDQIIEGTSDHPAQLMIAASS